MIAAYLLGLEAAHVPVAEEAETRVTACSALRLHARDRGPEALRIVFETDIARWRTVSDAFEYLSQVHNHRRSLSVISGGVGTTSACEGCWVLFHAPPRRHSHPSSSG